MKSFTARFIIRSVIVILALFLTIYFLFNLFANEFINDSADSDLRVRIHNNSADAIATLGNGWREMEMEDAILNFLDLPSDATPGDSLALAILSDLGSDDYIIINERGMIGTSINVLGSSDLVLHDGSLMDKRIFLANYYRENRNLFEIGEIIILETDDQVFHLRTIATDFLEELEQEFPTPPTPLTILLYTNVTEMVNFKNTINQILIIGLTFTGLIILATTVRMSSRFNQTIKKLSDYAEELGHGKFDAKIEPLRYSEFQKLANSMGDMSNMLATYEVNQKQFFQNASHELRTPLMAVQCYSEGILADVFEPNDAANIINSEIEKMTELVSSILYLSRIDHHTLQLEPTSTNEFLTDCHNQIKVLSDNNNIELHFAPLEQDLQINIDASLLERAVLNILSNALRYAETKITISVEKYLHRNIFSNIRQNMIRISIFNNGTHVDEKDLPHLFERFYKGNGGNTGLGLSITKEIILVLDGKIKVENVENGVCFTITLPVYENKEQPHEHH